MNRVERNCRSLLGVVAFWHDNCEKTGRESTIFLWFSFAVRCCRKWADVCNYDLCTPGKKEGTEFCRVNGLHISIIRLVVFFSSNFDN